VGGAEGQAEEDDLADGTQADRRGAAGTVGQGETRGVNGTWGRKPLLLIAFGVLPIRGVQIMDGVGAGIFGVVSVLVIADLTRGTGRFNLTLGAITTAVGIGAALSQVIAGSIVHHVGFRAGFLFLAGVASAAFAILYFFMPETRNIRLARE
jgi:MFS family permease